MVIVLTRIIGERVFTKFPARPGEIKWMFQQVFLRNVIVDLIEVLVHHDSPMLFSIATD